MDVATVTAARIHAGQKSGAAGEEHTLAFEQLPHLALVKTYTTDSQVPDSAGTATAMLSGVKTRSGVINVGPEPHRGDCRATSRHRLAMLTRDAERRGNGHRRRDDHPDHPRDGGGSVRGVGGSQL